MANTKKFIVKNGVTTPNISFKDSNKGATITATMNDSTDTLSFEGNAGQLFSITDALTGTLFAVSDISGIPSIEVDDQGIIKLAEFNGKVLVNTTDSGSTDSDVLNVGGHVRIDMDATDTRGVTLKSGAIQIRTDSAPGYVDFYCEVSNAHRTRLKSAAHASYSGNVDVTLPVVTGTLLTTAGDGSSLTNLNASNLASGTVPSARLSLTASDIPNLATSKITSGTFDSARMPLGVFGGGGGGSGTGNTFSNHTSSATLAAFTTAIADTSGGAFTLTLPASPSTNDQVIIVDGKGTFGSNNLTVGRNGKNIQGSASNLILDVNNVTVRLNYNGTEWRVFTISNTNGGTAVTLTGSQTLTNKVIALGSNTISGTTAQFNTALTDDDFATLTNSVTLTNKTLNNTLLQNYDESVVNIGNTGSSRTLSTSNGTVQKATLNSNCTFSFGSAASNGGSNIVLSLTQGGSFTATFTGVKFPGGSAPTITTGLNKIDVISFYCDGTNWYGNAIQDMA